CALSTRCLTPGMSWVKGPLSGARPRGLWNVRHTLDAVSDTGPGHEGHVRVLRAVSERGQRLGGEGDLREGRGAALARGRLRQEAGLQRVVLHKPEVADELPVAAVVREVERTRAPDPRHAQPDRVPLDNGRVAVVRDTVRHDRDDHRLAVGRVLEAQ